MLRWEAEVIVIPVLKEDRWIYYFNVRLYPKMNLGLSELVTLQTLSPYGSEQGSALLGL